MATAQPSKQGAADAGFSLLEVLVALALIATALSVSTVAIGPMIERREKAAERRVTELLLRDARYAALTSSAAVNVADYAPGFFQRTGAVPQVIKSDVEALPNGLCSGSRLDAASQERAARYQLDATRCVLVPLP